MVLARVANFFTNGDDATHDPVDNGRRAEGGAMDKARDIAQAAAVVDDEVDDEAARPPYLHVRRPGPTPGKRTAS